MLSNSRVLWFFILKVHIYGFVWNEWETMSHNERGCFSTFLFTFWELSFCILLCNSRCHLKWAVDHLRWRLPAWSVTVYTFVHLPLSVCVRVCVLVCVFVAGFKSSWMVFDKWHAALQKAAVRWLTNSGFVDNWDIAEGDLGLHSCQLEADCVICYPVRADKTRDN